MSVNFYYDFGENYLNRGVHCRYMHTSEVPYFKGLNGGSVRLMYKADRVLQIDSSNNEVRWVKHKELDTKLDVDPVDASVMVLSSVQV